MRTLMGFVIALVGGGVGWLAWDLVPDARDDWSALHLLVGTVVTLIAACVGVVVARGGAGMGALVGVVALLGFAATWIWRYQEETGLFLAGLLFFLILATVPVVVAAVLTGVWVRRRRPSPPPASSGSPHR